MEGRNFYKVEKMTQARLDSLDSQGGDRRRYGGRWQARDGLMVVILHVYYNNVDLLHVPVDVAACSLR